MQGESAAGHCLQVLPTRQPLLAGAMGYCLHALLAVKEC